jgi:hypothetical protein
VNLREKHLFTFVKHKQDLLKKWVSPIKKKEYKIITKIKSQTNQHDKLHAKIVHGFMILFIYSCFTKNSMYMKSNQLSLSLSGSRNQWKRMTMRKWRYVPLLSGEGNKEREWGKSKEMKCIYSVLILYK